MEKCPVCGQTYGITHACPGASAPWPAVAEVVPPSGFAPAYYFRQAIGIARLEDAPILRASRDENAFIHGLMVWAFGQFLLFIGLVSPVLTRASEVNWFLVAFQFSAFLVLDGIIYFSQYAVCHLLARVMLGARGTYLGLLRAMLLGSVVTWLGWIPFIGVVLAGLWGIAVLMRVFEEVEQVERLKAFTLAVIVGIGFQILIYLLFVPKH
jgi:hypothetical protein